MNAELFYVLDLGDFLTETLFGRFFQPALANAVGHLVSFAINSALWLGFIAIASRVI